VRTRLERIIELSVTGAGADRVEAATLPFFQSVELDLDEARESGILANFVERLSSPWFRYFLAHDPMEDLRLLRQPVLAVYGALDRLTSPSLNAAPLVSALSAAGNSDVTLRVVPEQDHFFLRADGLPPGEHAFGRMHVAPELLDLLAAWLAERF
jgi:uncharacterized protein